MTNKGNEGIAMRVFAGMIQPSFAMLLLYILIPLSVYADTISDFNDEVSVDIGIERVRSIDFDTFVDGTPTCMEMNVGATTGETDLNNLIEQDTCVFVTKESSLRITGTDLTTQWRSLSVDIPDDVRFVTVKLFVKGENLQRELNQFGNCYAGFWYDGLFGDKSNTLTALPQGSFDWTEVTISLDLDAHLARDVNFTLFSSISGTLWIDELTFLYDDECGDMGQSGVQESLSSYISELYQPTTFMELVYAADRECPDSISTSEVLQDIEMLKYLFENAYSGYTYWNNQSVDFSTVYDDLAELTDGNRNVSVVDMEHIIVDGLEEIQDGHLAVTGHERYRFLSRKSPFFADVIVERIQSENEEIGFEYEYCVIRSNCDSVEPGMIYVGSEDRLFRILSRNDCEQFQLGVFTNEYTTEDYFQFLAKPVDEEITHSNFRVSFPNDSAQVIPITLPLHECRLNRGEQQDHRIYYRVEIDGIDFIRISSFAVNHHETLLEFAESGAALAETNRFIVDLMGNHGGSSVYGRDFIKGLNGVAQWRMYYAMLCSPATIGSIAAMPINEGMPEEFEETINRMQQALERLRERPVRNWMYVRDELPARQMGNYEGCAAFLIDRGVASSGEALIDYSKSVPGAVLIGENSAGVGSFGEVRRYWLPNSFISLSLPSKLFLAPGFEEGIGYLPDYWLDSPEPVIEVARWLNNPDSYQFELSEPLVLHDYSFDDFDDGLPRHIQLSIGATSGSGQLYSIISQDCDIKTNGISSLRMEGSIDTDCWYALSQYVPQNTGTLCVEYNIRGENIHREGNQFDNCYVGFIYRDSHGNRHFCTNKYDGSFAWKQDSLQLNIEELDASSIQFFIFLSKSGTIWIDDVVFSE
ncbi:MAG: hypothetical protein KAW14_11970 [Candidatus Aegiribacteria sp.]|nr:hypothetical protein [Candidatus Aegiribacteria sp.]